MREKLYILYQLQELDRDVALKTREIKGHPILEEFNALKESYQAAKDEISSIQEGLKKENKKIRKAEMDLQGIAEDIRELKGKLYSGEIRNTKELEQYEKKAQGREKEKSSKEEELLTIMEEVEKEEEKIKRLTEQLQRERSRLKEVQSQGQNQINQIKSEIEELNRKREELRKGVDAPLLDQYDKDVSKYQGLMIARVKGNMCEGCRVFLSSSVLSILDNPSTKLKCENCGRILLKG
jgi:uncharacterized protein